MAAVSLAWALAHPGIGAVVVGASKPEQVVHNAAAASLKVCGASSAKQKQTQKRVWYHSGKEGNPGGMRIWVCCQGVQWVIGPVNEPRSRRWQRWEGKVAKFYCHYAALVEELAQQRGQQHC